MQRRRKTAATLPAIETLRPHRRSNGFTLPELVVVITILGILAAFAVTKYVTLDSSARISTVRGLAGTVMTAASLARGMSMATGNPATIIMEGNTVTLLYNYPDATATGIGTAVNYSPTDFSFTPSSDGVQPASWQKIGAPGVCAVFYSPPPSAGATPVISTALLNC
jgi:MSHA pilin protein MshA